MKRRFWIGFVLAGGVAACGGKKQEPGPTAQAGSGSNSGSAAPVPVGPPQSRGPDVLLWGDCVAPGEVMVSGMQSRAGTVLSTGPLAGPPKPWVEPVVDKEMIGRLIDADRDEYVTCYQKQLAITPTLTGTLDTKFTIMADGTVADVKTSGFDPAVGACVAPILQRLRFPKPAAGGTFKVDHPINFALEDDVKAGSGTAGALAAGKGKAALPPPPGPLPETTPDDAPSILEGLAGMDPIEQCIAKQPRAYGAFAFEWNGGPVKIIGIDDKKLEACLAQAVSTAAIKKPQRCGLAWGESVPEAERHQLAIRGGDVRLDTEPTTLANLGAAFDKHLPAPSATTVVIRGPVLLMPASGTSMAFINTIFKTAAASHVDLVLAGTNGLPIGRVWGPVIPPVGLATAGSFTGMVAIKAPADPRKKLSITVTKTKFILGVDGATKDVDRDWAKLEWELKVLMASTFHDRGDYEVGAADDVSYDDVLKVLDTAASAGYYDWKVYAPDQLTTRVAL